MHLVESMAYAGEVPWHGLGNPVSPDMDPEQMLAAAKLGWPVYCLPGRFKLNGKVYETTEVKILVREYEGEVEVLGPAGPEYVPVQNREVMDFFKGFTNEAGVVLETAGSLDGGRYVWALARFTESWTMMDEKFNDYLFIVSPHIWGRSLKIFYTPIRVVCFNTMMMALRGAKVSQSQYRHLHHAQFDNARMKKARDILGMSQELADAFRETAQTLARIKADEAAAAKFFAKLFVPTLATAKTEEQMNNGQIQYWMGLRESQIGGKTEAADGTYWGLVNAVTFAFDHVRGNSRETRMESAWFGVGASKKLEALDLAKELAGVE